MLEVVVSVADSQDLRTAAATKTSLKKRIRVLSIFIFDFPQSLTFSNVGELSWSWISKNRNHVPAKRERKFCRPLFAFSTKREIRHFYVVAEQWRQRNHVQKKVWCSSNVVFFPVKRIAFLTFSSPSPWSALKASIYPEAQLHTATFVLFWKTIYYYYYYDYYFRYLFRLEGLLRYYSICVLYHFNILVIQGKISLRMVYFLKLV